MSDKTDYGFDLDSILAEFSSDGGAQDTEPPKPVRPAKPAKPVKAPAPIPDPAPRTAQPVRRAVEPARPAAPAPSPVRTEPKKANAGEFDPEFFRYRPEAEKPQRPQKPSVRRAPVIREPEPEPEIDEEAVVSP